MQFDSVKSMIRAPPPNHIAGFGRNAVKGRRRSPWPPASMNACVRGKLLVEVVFIGLSASALDSFVVFGYVGGLSIPHTNGRGRRKELLL